MRQKRNKHTLRLSMRQALCEVLHTKYFIVYGQHSYDVRTILQSLPDTPRD